MARALRTETIGGAFLLAAAVCALIWANSPWREGYATLRDTHVAVPWVGVDLSVGHWASDGLLAIFFFVAGLELKREFLVGDLRDPAKAMVPMVAAACGVAGPAIVYAVTVTVLDAGPGALRGWAIPTATDIAFALAVLAVLGSHLPSGLRSFLLTLAIVDDLIAIGIIAIVYTSSLTPGYLLAALVPLAAFAVLTQRRITHPVLLLPLALATWVLVLHSGVHATIAGVLLGFVVPVRPRRGVSAWDIDSGTVDLAERFEHRVRPVSAGVAVPVFAFMASGVTLVGGGVRALVVDPVVVAIVLALVLGKLIGVFGSTWLLARFTRAELDEDLAWSDVLGLALLTGIGFTVSLLIGELAFGSGSERDDHVRAAVMLGSTLAAVLGGLVLRRRNAVYARIAERESHDDSGPASGPGSGPDGGPDSGAESRPDGGGIRGGDSHGDDSHGDGDNGPAPAAPQDSVR